MVVPETNQWLQIELHTENGILSSCFIENEHSKSVPISSKLARLSNACQLIRRAHLLKHLLNFPQEFLNYALARTEGPPSLNHSVTLRLDMNNLTRGICHSFWLEQNFKNNTGFSKLIRLWNQNKAKVLAQPVIKFHSYFEKNKPNRNCFLPNSFKNKSHLREDN